MGKEANVFRSISWVKCNGMGYSNEFLVGFDMKSHGRMFNHVQFDAHCWRFFIKKYALDYTVANRVRIAHSKVFQ